MSMAEGGQAEMRTTWKTFSQGLHGGERSEGEDFLTRLIRFAGSQHMSSTRAWHQSSTF